LPEGVSAESPCTPFTTEECRTNYMCNEMGFCEGQPVPDGTACTPLGGCMTGGMCQHGTCVGTVAQPDNTACSYPGLEKCYTRSHCMTVGGVFSFCVLGPSKTCPPSSDPCKASYCNPQNGECFVGDRCSTYNGCETCNAGTCTPVNIGARCANPEGDFNPCT